MHDYLITIDGETVHGLFQGDASVAKLLEQALNQVLEAHVVEQVSAERTEERQGYRNGVRPRTLTTRVGQLTLRVPQVREAQFAPVLFARYQRSEQALVTVAEPGGLHLVYVDECDIHTHPYLAKVWQRKGQPLKIPAAGEDQKAVVFGAVDCATGQVLWQTSPRKGKAALSAFLDDLAEALWANEPVMVVLDNVGYHTSHALREVWWRYASRLEPFFLPDYAPQPNLIERL